MCFLNTRHFGRMKLFVLFLFCCFGGLTHCKITPNYKGDTSAKSSAPLLLGNYSSTVRGRIGDSLSLYCGFNRGDLNESDIKTLYWFKYNDNQENEKIPSKSNSIPWRIYASREVTDKEFQLLLTINKIEKHDARGYFCNAYNSVGSQEQSLPMELVTCEGATCDGPMKIHGKMNLRRASEGSDKQREKTVPETIPPASNRFPPQFLISIKSERGNPAKFFAPLLPGNNNYSLTVTKNVGESFNISCGFNQSDLNLSDLKFINWFKYITDGSAHRIQREVDKIYTIRDNTDNKYQLWLTINNIQKDDARDYVCETRIYSDGWWQRFHVKLVVNGIQYDNE